MKKLITALLIFLCLCFSDQAIAGCKCKKKKLIKKTVTVHQATKKYNSNLDRYLDLSRQGDKQGTYAAANAYYTGEETSINYAYAIPFFSKIPDYYDSSFKIATMFRSGGYGIQKSTKDAVKWFTYYTEIKEEPTYYAPLALAEIYENGELTGTPDIETAKHWYKKAKKAACSSKALEFEKHGCKRISAKVKELNKNAPFLDRLLSIFSLD
jgi:TPR repeat protein